MTNEEKEKIKEQNDEIERNFEKEIKKENSQKNAYRGNNDELRLKVAKLSVQKRKETLKRIKAYYKQENLKFNQFRNKVAKL